MTSASLFAVARTETSGRRVSGGYYRRTNPAVSTARVPWRSASAPQTD
jgi:hypothetical protein